LLADDADPFGPGEEGGIKLTQRKTRFFEDFSKRKEKAKSCRLSFSNGERKELSAKCKVVNNVAVF
jgi:hypothetical protein